MTKRFRLSGYLAGWGLFILVGLPWSVLFLLGERECDMHIGPPCTLDWRTTKLIHFAVVILVCWFVGWTANRLLNRRRDTSPAQFD